MSSLSVTQKQLSIAQIKMSSLAITQKHLSIAQIIAMNFRSPNFIVWSDKITLWKSQKNLAIDMSKVRELGPASITISSTGDTSSTKNSSGFSDDERPSSLQLLKDASLEFSEINSLISVDSEESVVKIHRYIEMLRERADREACIVS